MKITLIIIKRYFYFDIFLQLMYNINGWRVSKTSVYSLFDCWRAIFIALQFFCVLTTIKKIKLKLVWSYMAGVCANRTHLWSYKPHMHGFEDRRAHQDSSTPRLTYYSIIKAILQVFYIIKTFFRKNKENLKKVLLFL